MVPPEPDIRGNSADPGDFRRLDFDRLWSGRGRTTEVELRVIDRALGSRRFGRLLELGTGAGRLTPSLVERANEYLGIDLHPEFVARASATVDPREGRRFLSANLYRLPLAPSSVDAVVAIRVFNFLDGPTEALRELARIVAPGGVLLLSVNPHPSLGSFMDDLKVALAAPSAGRRSRPRTFSRGPRVRVEPSDPPAWSWRRGEWRRIVASAGWRMDAEFQTGLEDYRWLRAIPGASFSGWATIRPILGVRSHWFQRWIREGAPGRLSAAPLQCPRCGTPIDVAMDPSPTCPGCGAPRRREGGIWDLREPPSPR